MKRIFGTKKEKVRRLNALFKPSATSKIEIAFRLASVVSRFCEFYMQIAFQYVLFSCGTELENWQWEHGEGEGGVFLS